MSPALALLDMAPTSVERPQSPKALAVNLLSLLKDNSGIPKNYAMDLSPYWLISHPGLTFSDYYRQSDIAANLVRTFSISVATAPIPTSSSQSAAGTHLGLGLRAMLLPGRANNRLVALRDQLRGADSKLHELARPGANPDLDKLEQRRDDLQAALSRETDPGKRAALEEQVRSIEDAEAKLPASPDEATWRDKAKTLALAIQNLDAQRRGFMVAIAEAQVWDFPGDTFANRTLSRWGFWATPAYRYLPRCEQATQTEAGATSEGSSAASAPTCDSAVDVIGVVRYLRDRATGTVTSKWDIGGRLLWQPTKALALSAEMLRRRSQDTSDGSTHRETGLVEYRIRDDLLLFVGFGRNFDDAPDHRTLYSVLGLNLGLGQKPIIDLSK